MIMFKKRYYNKVINEEWEYNIIQSVRIVLVKKINATKLQTN